jgi:hypothetical protein
MTYMLLSGQAKWLVMPLKEHGGWYTSRTEYNTYYQDSKGGPARTDMLLLGLAGWYQDRQDATVRTGSAGPQDRQACFAGITGLERQVGGELY